MSGTEETDPDLLAAEYVLGTLDEQERASVSDRAETDDGLRTAISAWEMRLEPLTQLVRPVSPPARLWSRVEASCGISAQRRDAAGRLRARLWNTVGFWRGATGLGFGLAAVLAALAIFHEPSPPLVPIASAVLAPKPGAAPVFVAEVVPNGTIVMRALTRVAVADDKSLELWALPDGATVPKAIGVFKPGGQSLQLPAGYERGPMQLMISLEQAGGSPTGLPQGPVLYAGHYSRT